VLSYLTGNEDGRSKSDDRELLARGKSELRRAGCWVTPSKGDFKESATEIKPPVLTGKGETVR